MLSRELGRDCTYKHLWRCPLVPSKISLEGGLQVPPVGLSNRRVVGVPKPPGFGVSIFVTCSLAQGP